MYECMDWFFLGSFVREAHNIISDIKHTFADIKQSLVNVSRVVSTTFLNTLLGSFGELFAVQVFSSHHFSSSSGTRQNTYSLLCNFF